jgi:tripartite ATP-independent transporter DctM subunit
MTFFVFALLLLLQVPIGICLCLTAVFYIWYSGNTVLFESYAQQLFGSVESYGLLAIPLFILAGELMNEGGLTRRLINFARVFFGGFRGGLAYINLLANMMMASIMGSANAQIAIMSRAIVPEMEREGYDKTFSTAITAAAGLMGPIIPPSMLFVIYGVLAQISIGDMFIGGIIPGILMGLAFFLIVAGFGFIHTYPKGRWPNAKEAVQSVIQVIPALGVPIIIIGGILSGLATPTESAGLASLAALLAGKFCYGDLKLGVMPDLLKRTALNSALVVFLVASAGVFGWTITFEKIPQMVAEWIGASTSSPFVFMLLVMAQLLIVGMLIEGIAALILVVPILLPIAVDQFGISPVHFGVVVCLNLVLGLLTPPVGTGLFVASAMTGISPMKIAKALIPFLVSVILLLIWFSYDPWPVMVLLE